MAGDTGARRGPWPPGPESCATTPKSFLLRGFIGPRGPRLARYWRVLFSGVWLIYVVSPVGTLFHHHYGLLYIGGGFAISVVFCLCYLYLVATWDVRRRRTLTGLLAVLFALAALACVVYNGAKWNTLFIYVSAVSSLVFANPRIGARAVALAAACYALFSWIGHDDLSDFLITLLPVLLVGFAMIGLRLQINMTRELAAARDSVAKLAASEERLRLARDMHDLTGQSLSIITLKSELAALLLRRLPEGPERDRVRDEIEQVASVSRQTLQDIREAVSGYRRPTLAVEMITARTALEAAGIAPHDSADLTTASGTFDPDAEAALAWCLREAVTNVVRHSGASECHISLRRHGDTLSLVVRDDGRGPAQPYEWPIHTAIGVSMSHSSGASGLRGMSERLAAVGGHLELRPGTPAGFCLIATVPALDATVPAGDAVAAGDTVLAGKTAARAGNDATLTT
jgi:two-component system sensor histidine kinase DesK